MSGFFEVLPVLLDLNLRNQINIISHILSMLRRVLVTKTTGHRLALLMSLQKNVVTCFVYYIVEGA